MLTLAALAGCGPISGTARPSPAADTAALPAPLPATSVPTAAALSAPAVPPDWIETVDSATGIRIQHPPTWALAGASASRAEFQDSASLAWLEVSIITEANAFEWGLDYDAEAPVESVLETLLSASTGGAGGTPAERILMQDGGSGWAASGWNPLINDRVWIGVTRLPQGLVLVLGHYELSESETNWPDGLVDTYSTLFSTVAPGG